MAWLDSGGAFAVANLRGGGEYGDAWHDAGRRAKKQNVFDDFIAAGEWLIANGVTPKPWPGDRRRIEWRPAGRRGGQPAAGSVRRGHPAVGVMDMLRFDQFTAGRYWVDDYGYPEKEADWRVLRTYSPYHNIRAGVDYPAILVTTADTDDRRSRPQLQVYGGASGGGDRAEATPDPHRNARRAWLGQADRQADRGNR
jgi:prolyl oligopeptidase